MPNELTEAELFVQLIERTDLLTAFIVGIVAYHTKAKKTPREILLSALENGGQ